VGLGGRGGVAPGLDGAARGRGRAGVERRADSAGGRDLSVAGALDGLRILEVGRFVGTAYATKLLADLGADVVKIEPPEGGDPIRRRGPYPGGVPHPERSGLFLYLNTNKRGIALDLRQPRG